MISTVACGSVLHLLIFKRRREAVRPLPSDFKALTEVFLCCMFITSLGQIVCALEQDDGARKQRLAFKLEQVVALMTLESWGPHFPGRTGKRPHQKPSCAWAKTCPHLFPSCDFLPPPFRDDFFLGLFSASSCPKVFWVFHPHCCIN